MHRENRGIVSAFISNGIFPFILMGIILILTGIFLITQSIMGKFLPHDIESLGMSAAQLSVFNNGTIVNFMFHDRISFGGSLIAVGLLYMWLAEFPLRNKEAWAWWLFLLSGMYGFGSFLSYIGYGYFDLWHAVGTVCLLPIYFLGLICSYRYIEGEKNIRCLLKRKNNYKFKSKEGIGNFLLLFTSAGLFLGGAVIMIVGMTSVFVPQDLEYMQINVCGLEEINRKLIPIIAHDRASFGGGLATIGIMFFFSIYCSPSNKALWQILAVSISIGFYAAIGVHFLIGYLNFSHIAPAYFGLIAFYAGLFLSYENMCSKKNANEK